MKIKINFKIACGFLARWCRYKTKLYTLPIGNYLLLSCRENPTYKLEKGL